MDRAPSADSALYSVAFRYSPINARSPALSASGSFSAKRAFLTYAFFFKYMLDNNLDKADGIGADVVIRSELFGNE